MRVVHESDGESRSIATNVDVADSFVSQTVGLMGKSSLPEDYALVFEFDDSEDGWLAAQLGRLPFVGRTPRRFIHMLFVRMSLDVLWLRDDEVVQVSTLSPWTGVGIARADRIVELPAGTAAEVSMGDTVVVTDGNDSDGETAA